MSAGPEIRTRRLAPGARLKLGRGEHTLVVQEGVLYVALADDEVALIAGDEIVVTDRTLRGAWNAGADTAEVAVLTRPTEARRARRRPRAGSGLLRAAPLRR